MTERQIVGHADRQTNRVIPIEWPLALYSTGYQFSQSHSVIMHLSMWIPSPSTGRPRVFWVQIWVYLLA